VQDLLPVDVRSEGVRPGDLRSEDVRSGHLLQGEVLQRAVPVQERKDVLPFDVRAEDLLRSEGVRSGDLRSGDLRSEGLRPCSLQAGDHLRSFDL